jgi:hypothetical protein
LKDLGQIAAKFSYNTTLRLGTIKVLNPCADQKIDGEVPVKALKSRAISHQST